MERIFEFDLAVKQFADSHQRLIVTICDESGNSIESGVIVTYDSTNPPQNFGHIDFRICVQHRLDINPVLGSIEDGFADYEVIGRQYFDGALGEWNGAPSPSSCLVKWVV